MDELCRITEEDKQRMREAWYRDAPPHARGYIDAEPEERTQRNPTMKTGKLQASIAGPQS